MEHRQLGARGPRVPAIGLGFWSIGGGYAARDEPESRRTVGRALELGATLFDTAPTYGDAEEFLGRVLGPARRARVFLTTKCGIGRDPVTGRTRPDGRPAALRQQVEASLRRLRCDYVDRLLVHWPDHAVPIAETAQALERLRREGFHPPARSVAAPRRVPPGSSDQSDWWTIIGPASRRPEGSRC